MAIPEELARLRRWLLWKIEERTDGKGDKKKTKVPYQAKNPDAHASSTDANTWASLEEAQEACCQAKLDGIGFALGDGITGIDLDHVRDPATGAIEPWALGVVDQLDSYTEISPSGTGLHILVHGSLPAGSSGRKRAAKTAFSDAGETAAIEIYDFGRYFTITGNQVAMTPDTLEERTEALAELHARAFPIVDTKAAPPKTLSDDQLLFKAKRASNGTRFALLFDAGDWKAAGYSSQSEADLALCNWLAFWTNRDAGRIDALFRRSGLFRAKWDEVHFSGGETYGSGNINKAIRDTHDGYELEKPRLRRNGVKAQNVIANPEDPERYTDLGNARRLVRLHGDDIRYCSALGWMAWDGKRWLRDDSGEIERRAMDVSEDIYREAVAIDAESVGKDKETAKEIRERADLARKHAHKSESEPSIRRMIELACALVPIAVEAFDRDPWLLTCANGTIDLRTGELRAHRRDDFLSRMSPTSFNRDAKAPQWLQLLDLVTAGNKQLQFFLQRVAGYCLTAEYREQCFFLLHGKGKNGKSTFISIFRAALGEHAVAAQFSTFLARREGGGIRSDVARLRGSRMVTAIESQEGRLDEGLIKQLTGGDPVVACFKYKDEFEFMPTFKLLLAANERPKIRGNDEGIWRRVRLVPFEVTIPEEKRDKDFDKKVIASELPGVLAWAVAGCQAWQIEGLGEPQEVKKATTEYREEEDELAPFIAEECNQGDPDVLLIGARELYTRFHTWALAEGIDRPWSEKTFSGKMKDRGFIKCKTHNNKRGWRGIELRPATLPQQDTPRQNGGG